MTIQKYLSLTSCNCTLATATSEQQEILNHELAYMCGMRVFVCVCVHMCVKVCVHAAMCAYTYVCMCVYVWICINLTLIYIVS